MIRPLGFDDTKQRQECASSCVMLNKALSSLSKIGETTDHEPSDRHRKLFLEKFDEVQQASLDAKEICAEQSAFFSERYGEIDAAFSESEKIRSDLIDLSFKQILNADFKHQADVYKSTCDVLIETVNIPATEEELPEKLSPFEHFNHGCWDVLELLGVKLKAIEIIKSACYNLSFRFCFYKLKSFDGKPTDDHFYLLHKSSRGGLFMRKVSTQRTLHFIAGSWKNEKFCMDSREISPSPNPFAEVSPIDMTEWIKQEMIKLNGYAKHYHEGFFPGFFTFKLSDYVFQLQIPPRHSSTCKNPDDLILKAGFPGEVDNDYKIGNCKCTNDDEKAYIKTYTKICKLLFLVNRKGVKIFKKKHSTNGFNIDFQSCAELKQEIVTDWRFYVHRDEQKIALNHPKYFPADHKIDILLVDQMYNLSSRNPIAEDFTRDEQTSMDIFEIFNLKEPAAKKKNMFFSEI
ncbi:unnamed protein product, partial [Mesorhabditis belari]|uniref:Uncharacterized protein n=1 Tax=Mesorhabditis belari TaxID=2138241 RepID=A0AAF3EUX0_9BILA